jgi:multisubunit Na+/H+ antiporter MnhB subunit
MPYGFYQFVRFTAMVGFAYLAYSAKEQNKQNEVFIYFPLAILFQPFFKLALGRNVWNIVDVIVGIGLVIKVIKDSKIK